MVLAVPEHIVLDALLCRVVQVSVRGTRVCKLGVAAGAAWRQLVGEEQGEAGAAWVEGRVDMEAGGVSAGLACSR